METLFRSDFPSTADKPVRNCFQATVSMRVHFIMLIFFRNRLKIHKKQHFFMIAQFLFSVTVHRINGAEYVQRVCSKQLKHFHNLSAVSSLKWTCFMTRGPICSSHENTTEFTQEKKKLPAAVFLKNPQHSPDSRARRIRFHMHLCESSSSSALQALQKRNNVQRSDVHSPERLESSLHFSLLGPRNEKRYRFSWQKPLKEHTGTYDKRRNDDCLSMFHSAQCLLNTCFR